jgi:hypothetical protein
MIVMIMTKNKYETRLLDKIQNPKQETQKENKQNGPLLHTMEKKLNGSQIVQKLTSEYFLHDKKHDKETPNCKTKPT